MARALSFYGGVPQLIVPDNPRALIADARPLRAASNETVLDFARHYGTSILPARPVIRRTRPRSSRRCRSSTRWILARLRHQRSDQRARGRRGHRAAAARAQRAAVPEAAAAAAPALFAALDAPALLPLPVQP